MGLNFSHVLRSLLPLRWRWPGRQLNGYDFRAKRGWPELPGGGFRCRGGVVCANIYEAHASLYRIPPNRAAKLQHPSHGCYLPRVVTYIHREDQALQALPHSYCLGARFRRISQKPYTKSHSTGQLSSCVNPPPICPGSTLRETSLMHLHHAPHTCRQRFSIAREVSRKHRASQLQQSTGLVGQCSSPHFYRTPRLKELPHPPSLSLGFPAGCFLHGHHPPSRQRGPQFPSSLKPHGPASLKEEEKSRITVTATYEGNLVDAQHSPGWSSICLTSRSSTEFDKLEVRSGSWLSTAPRRSMSCLNSRFALPCACLHADSEYAALVIPSIHLILHNA